MTKEELAEEAYEKFLEEHKREVIATRDAFVAGFMAACEWQESFDEDVYAKGYIGQA